MLGRYVHDLPIQATCMGEQPTYVRKTESLLQAADLWKAGVDEILLQVYQDEGDLGHRVLLDWNDEL
jgi:hypothetical protein